MTDKATTALDQKLFADLQLTDEVLGNDYAADGVTVVGTCRIPLGDLLRKGIVPLDAPLATVNSANTVSVAGPIFGQTTDDKLVIKWSETAGTNGWTTPFATTAQGALADTALQPGDVVNDLVSGGTDLPGSAQQLVVLKGYIDAINSLLASDDTSLDELQEIVDYVKLNRADLDALGIASIAGLQAALDSKQATLVEVSQAIAEAGTDTTIRGWTAERVKQAIVAIADLSAQIGYAEEWANAAEDTLVSAAAGGDQVDDYSAKHHAAKASGHKDSAAASAASVGDSRHFMDAERFCSKEHMKARLAEVAAGTSKQLTVLQIGDSLTQKTSVRLMEDYLREWFPGDAYRVGGAVWSFQYNVEQNGTDGGGTTFSLNGTSWVSKTDYDLEFTGTYFNLTSAIGDVQVSGGSTTRLNCDKITIPYVIEPGAGTFKVQVNNANTGWGNPADAGWEDPVSGEITSGHALTGSELIVDADGSFGLGVIELDFTGTSGILSRMFQVVHQSGGTVRFLIPCFLRLESDLGTVNTIRMGQGSNDFGSTTDASVPLMAAFIAANKPDVITTQSDDSAASYEAFLPRLRSAIDQANLGYEPLVILIGEAAFVSSASKAPTANNMQAKYASLYNWYFFNGLNVVRDYDDLVELGWEGDGTHHSATLYKEFADRIAVDLGWDQYPSKAASSAFTGLHFSKGDADFEDWKSRVTTNSGTLTATHEAIARSLCIELYRLGIRGKIEYLLPILGSDVAANVVPLIDDLSAGNASVNALLDGDFSDSTGFQKATGSDHYIDTGLDHNDIAVTPDESWGVYFKGRTAGSPFGVRQNSKDEIGWESNMDLHPFGWVNDERWSNVTFTNTSADGLHVFQNSGGHANWYLNGIFQQTRGAANSNTDAPTRTWKLGCMHWFDGSILETDAAVGFFFHGKFLSAAEIAGLQAVFSELFNQELSR